jgi:2-dehydro-3-deoxyphosphogluconate aldolase / (4S)-4-hydroxy-2-oxoglutarate aldolase
VSAAPVAEMHRNRAPQALVDTRVVAIFRRLPTERAVAAARALAAGGVRCVEITMDSDNALQTVAALRESLADDVAVGAGTVMDLATARSAADAGACFFVSPHADEALIRDVHALGIPYLPGAQTATEIVRAWSAGATAVKVFPSGPLGPPYIRDLLGPLRHVPLVPTGGITPETAPQFVAAGAWAVGVGSQLVPLDLLEAGRGDELSARAAALLEAVRAARGA